MTGAYMHDHALILCTHIIQVRMSVCGVLRDMWGVDVGP